MERAGTTGVDAAVPMVESSARLACDGEEDDDDDDKSWYDTYNMTGDGEKNKKKKKREERDTPTGTVLFDQLIRQTDRQSAVQIVMPYLTLPVPTLPTCLLSCHYEVLPTISIIKVTVWWCIHIRYFIFPTCTGKVPSQKKLWPPHR